MARIMQTAAQEHGYEMGQNHKSPMGKHVGRWPRDMSEVRSKRKCSGRASLPPKPPTFFGTTCSLRLFLHQTTLRLRPIMHQTWLPCTQQDQVRTGVQWQGQFATKAADLFFGMTSRLRPFLQQMMPSLRPIVHQTWSPCFGECCRYQGQFATKPVDLFFAMANVLYDFHVANVAEIKANSAPNLLTFFVAEIIVCQSVNPFLTSKD